MGRLGHKERGGRRGVRRVSYRYLQAAGCILHAASASASPARSSSIMRRRGEGQENEKAVFSSSGSRKRTSTPALKRGRELLRSLGYEREGVVVWCGSSEKG